MNYIFVLAVDNVERYEWARIGIASIRRYTDRIGATLILHRKRGNLFPFSQDEAYILHYPGNNKDQLVRDWKALGLE